MYIFLNLLWLLICHLPNNKYMKTCKFHQPRLGTHLRIVLCLKQRIHQNDLEPEELLVVSCFLLVKILQTRAPITVAWNRWPCDNFKYLVITPGTKGTRKIKQWLKRKRVPALSWSRWTGLMLQTILNIRDSSNISRWVPSRIRLQVHNSVQLFNIRATIQLRIQELLVQISPRNMMGHSLEIVQLC